MTKPRTFNPPAASNNPKAPRFRAAASPTGRKPLEAEAQTRIQAGTAGGARISRRAADRLRAGSLWVYASDIESIELPGGG